MPPEDKGKRRFHPILNERHPIRQALSFFIAVGTASAMLFGFFLWLFGFFEEAVIPPERLDEQLSQPPVTEPVPTQSPNGEKPRTAPVFSVYTPSAPAATSRSQQAVKQPEQAIEHALEPGSNDIVRLSFANLSLSYLADQSPPTAIFERDNNGSTYFEADALDLYQAIESLRLGCESYAKLPIRSRIECESRARQLAQNLQVYISMSTLLCDARSYIDQLSTLNNWPDWTNRQTTVLDHSNELVAWITRNARQLDTTRIHLPAGLFAAFFEQAWILRDAIFKALNMGSSEEGLDGDSFDRRRHQIGTMQNSITQDLRRFCLSFQRGNQ